jgi:hypothetical protein
MRSALVVTKAATARVRSWLTTNFEVRKSKRFQCQVFPVVVDRRGDVRQQVRPSRRLGVAPTAPEQAGRFLAPAVDRSGVPGGEEQTRLPYVQFLDRTSKWPGHVVYVIHKGRVADDQGCRVAAAHASDRNETRAMRGRCARASRRTF